MNFVILSDYIFEKTRPRQLFAAGVVFTKYG